MAYGLNAPARAEGSAAAAPRLRSQHASEAWRKLDRDRRLALIDCILGPRCEEFADGYLLAL
jgi:hypothetical protein